MQCSLNVLHVLEDRNFKDQIEHHLGTGVFM